MMMMIDYGTTYTSSFADLLAEWYVLYWAAVLCR